MIKEFFRSIWRKIFGSQNKETTPSQNEPVKTEEPEVIPAPSHPPVSNELPFNPKPNRDPSKRVLIVDVYHHDRIVDWKAIGDYADAIILKVSEGVNHKDTKIDLWREEAKKHGLVVGFYHFFRTNKNAVTQANFFCDIIGEIKRGEFMVACDFETEDDPADGYDIMEAMEFNAQVEKRLGIVPWFYGGHIFKQSGVSYKVPEACKRHPLWLSHYTSKARPVVPAPWEKELLWQFTETANVPGINNPKGTDLNYFNGTYEDILALCKK